MQFSAWGGRGFRTGVLGVLVGGVGLERCAVACELIPGADA